MGRLESVPHSAAALLLCQIALLPHPLDAQYTLTAPGHEMRLSRDRLVEMNDTTEALRENLETDPEVLYFTGFADPVTPASSRDALPWNAIEVLTDSSAAVLTPGNLREADRAYANYAVIRMQAVRADPDVRCDELMEREVRAVESFVDGWIVARTLYGGPPFAPLDELAFAREAGVLPGLIADAGDPQLGGCLAVWRADHEEEIRAYQAWRAGEPAGGEP